MGRRVSMYHVNTSGWHEVTVPTSDMTRPENLGWTKDNLRDQYVCLPATMIDGAIHITFRFSDERDAVIFKMRFG